MHEQVIALGVLPIKLPALSKGLPDYCAENAMRLGSYFLSKFFDTSSNADVTVYFDIDLAAVVARLEAVVAAKVAE